MSTVAIVGLSFIPLKLLRPKFPVGQIGSRRVLDLDQQPVGESSGQYFIDRCRQMHKMYKCIYYHIKKRESLGPGHKSAMRAWAMVSGFSNTPDVACGQTSLGGNMRKKMICIYSLNA